MRLSSPEVSVNPLDSVTRTEANADPVNFRQSGQWQFANMSNRPCISYLTAPQKQLPLIIRRSPLNLGPLYGFDAMSRKQDGAYLGTSTSKPV